MRYSYQRPQKPFISIKKKTKEKKKKIVIIHSFMNPPPLNVHYLNQQQLQVQRGLEGQQPA